MSLTGLEAGAGGPMVDATGLRSCDVLLFRGRGTISQLIRFLDGTDVSHVGLFDEGQVSEALSDGLLRRPLKVSTDPQHNEWVTARRLHLFHGPMQPVADRAAAFVAEGHKYAYEQMVLLAFLSAARKLPVSPVLASLMRIVLDKAAAAVETILAQGKQPMICSEFVYRCYHEAVPGDTDPYELEIDLSRQTVPAAPASVAMAPFPVSFHGRGIESGSLLTSPVIFQVPATPPEAAHAPAPPPPSDAEFDTVAQTYLREIAELGPRGNLLAPPTDAAAPGLQRFAFQIARSVDRQRRPSGATETPITAQQALGTLTQAAADFVTPGDLLRSRSLGLVGVIDVQ